MIADLAKLHDRVLQVYLSTRFAVHSVKSFSRMSFETTHPAAFMSVGKVLYFLTLS